jgi:hypothetical protein
MTTTQQRTVTMREKVTIVGVFEDRVNADKAVDDLFRAGFDEDQIGVAMRHDDELIYDATGEGHTHAGSCAVKGALTGLGLGTFAGLGLLAGVIPAVGPAIAGGTLGIVLSNAAAGARIVGLVGALVGAGIPEHEAKYYRDEFEAGRTIVTVTIDARPSDAAAILRRYGAYDISTRNAMTPV